MRKLFILSASAIALLASPALAAEETTAEQKIERGVEQVGEGLEKIGEGISAQVAQEAPVRAQSAPAQRPDGATTPASPAADPQQGMVTEQGNARGTRAEVIGTIRTEGVTLFAIPARHFSVERLIDMEVFDTLGNEVTEIYDVIVSPAGLVLAVVLEDGEFAGFDGEYVMTGFTDYKFVVDANEPDNVRAVYNRVDGSNTVPIAIFDYDRMPAGAYSYREHIDGMDVNTRESEGVAEIEDLIVDASGKVSHVMLDYDVFMELGGREVVIDFHRLQMAGPESNAAVDLTKDQVLALPRYETAER